MNVVSSSSIDCTATVQPAQSTAENIANVDNSAESHPGPMYSGDKIILPQYVECKCVAKIPNSGQPRKYASLLGYEDAIPLLYKMLGELM